MGAWEWRELVRREDFPSSEHLREGRDGLGREMRVLFLFLVEANAEGGDGDVGAGWYVLCRC